VVNQLPHNRWLDAVKDDDIHVRMIDEKMTDLSAALADLGCGAGLKRAPRKQFIA
jgi:hypothetical protein